MTYILNLKPETARRLEERAKAQGIAPEEFVEQLMETMVEPETESTNFDAIADYVLEKNAELYRRLA